jgi:signal transduction histidine kinase
MERTLQTRIIAIVLALLTGTACLFAALNFSEENKFENPTDGVFWVESHGMLEAERVPDGSAGQRAGIRTGDLLLSVNQQPTPRIASLVREWFRTKVYGSASYVIVRSGIRIPMPVILDQADESTHAGLRLIALVYLSIGLYVLFRRWTAPHATHFYIFCLTSFVMYAFIYTGRLNDFDQVIYWGWIGAGALQPALFLHFAFSFGETQQRTRRRLLLAFTYLPAVLVIAIQVYAIGRWSATGLLAHRLDQAAMAYLDFFYLLAAAVFYLQYRRTGGRSGKADPQTLRRQQLKWLTRGTVVTVLPFTLLYVLPYLTDVPTPDWARNLAILSLVVLPLTFSWAIVRYRLMDVDLIFKRGVTYTLATASLVGLYFALVAFAAELVNRRLPSAGPYGLIGAIIITSALFEPVKRIIQERVDRLFDRKRYDYRQTLIDFGRSLSTQTDLDTLLGEIVHRLPQTLLVARVAVFLRDDADRYRLATGHGLPAALFSPAGSAAADRLEPLEKPRLDEAFDLSFFDFDHPGAPTHIFLENPQHALHLPEAEYRTAAALDLNYYLPCRVQDRTIAVIGLGRTTDGDFLSSEDVELLESLAGYIGIALQNARLYASLQEKIDEYERLKEFNENIVESTNVGILAVDLEERIESWNAQMEVLFAMPRAEALGQKIDDVFAPSFVREFHRVKDEPGVHHLYKFRLETRPAGVPDSGPVLLLKSQMDQEGPRVANISIAPLVSRDFKILGRIVLVDDITARLDLEAQLAQAEKLSSIGLLAAGVAHEVNTPLAVISSYAQMLTKQLRARAANGDDLGDRLAPLLDKITQQTFRASEIVNGLLNFSRTSAAEFRETDVNAIIRDTLTLLEHQFKTSRVQLATDLDKALPPIHGNAGKLQQVFLNLFLNAKDAMAEGGTLRIDTRCTDCVTVSIRDSGSGIAPEHVQRIYDPFFTTKTAVKEGQRRGTGLGLAVTYGIMQEHAGKIRVESQPGSGTTFALEFPLKGKPAHV